MAVEHDQDQPDDIAGPGGRPGKIASSGGRPDDEAEVVAAIAAAVELCWPRPVPPEPPARERRPATPAWRFSGRWWSKPPQLRRDRPWAEP
jgi:hypothetical protein